MAGTKHTKLQRAEIRSLIAEYDRRGYENNRVVADLLRERHGLEMSPRMVCNYRWRIINEHLDKAEESRDDKVNVIKHKLRSRVKELMEAWDASRCHMTDDMAGQVVQKVKDLIDAQLPIPDNFTVELRADPNAAMVKLIIDCYKEECELEGLYAPKAQPVTNVNVNQQVAVGLDWSGAEQSQEQVAMEQAKRLIEVEVRQVIPTNGGVQ
jgi:D-ribose pyranose/furanose isomerase RbsD